MRDNAQQMRQSAGERASRLKEMNASDNMQSYAQLTMLHAQDLQNLSAAFQPLYASLSQDQQHAADTMFREVAMRRAPGAVGTSGYCDESTTTSASPAREVG